jgi:hypothetical protein
MGKTHSLIFYLKRAPGYKRDYDTVEEALKSYEEWKKEVAHYYKHNISVRHFDPKAYEILIDTKISENEIAKVTEQFYKVCIVKYSNELTSGEFDLE